MSEPINVCIGDCAHCDEFVFEARPRSHARGKMPCPKCKRLVKITKWLAKGPGAVEPRTPEEFQALIESVKAKMDAQRRTS